MADESDVILQEKVRVILAEYQELRKEIDTRGKAQTIAMTSAFVPIGMILGIIFNRPDNFVPLLVLVIPWILSILGITWLDNSHGISLIGTYIRDEIEAKKLPSNFNTPQEFTLEWENYLSRRESEVFLLRYIVTIFPWVIFIIPSIASIVAYLILRFTEISKPPPALEYSFIVVGTIPIIVLGFSWHRARKAKAPVASTNADGERRSNR